MIVLEAALLLGEHLRVSTIHLLELSELILLPVAQMAASQCFALERGLGASVALCLVPASRLLAVLILLVSIGAGTPELASVGHFARSEEHTSELQSLMRISYAVFCLKKKRKNDNKTHHTKTA